MSDVPPESDVDDILNRFDAAMDAKLRFHARAVEPTVGGAVTGPGQAATVGAGTRAARRTADTTGQENHLRHNWAPNGPRNVGGRVRALIVHPGNGNVMYAGSASGGVWKSVDGAQSWFPLWHDEPALPIGGLALCAANPNVIWAATGEHKYQPGDGIWRSTDDGATWENRANPHVPGAAGAEGTTFEAIAAHPTNVDRAWAVGASGVFRTMDGGQNWTQFRAGEHWSDVAYGTDSAGGVVLYLVPAVSAAGEASIVVLPNADDTDANVRAILPAPPTALAAAHVSQVLAPGGAGPNPAAGKIAVASGNPNRAYVRFADVNDGHRGVFRSANAQLNPAAVPPTTGSAVTWTQLVDSPEFAGEGQGDYNLTMAVTPNGQDIATGMVDLHVLTNAHTAPAIAPPPPPPDPWRKAVAWQIWANDRGFHADQHATVFAPDPAAPGTLLLWAGNDGGISVSRNWQAGIGHAAQPVIPLPPGAIAWEKRSEGLSAAQMYDLSQSPIVPGLIGCGFQDNGVFMSGGGPTWSLVMGADGGYVAFDPDDPYRFLATWQGGIAEVHVPGLLEQVAQPVGSSVITWPRSLHTGFSGADLAEFVAETVHHPSHGRSVFHTRRNVLYRRRSTTGERWQPVALGRGVELRHDTANPTATLQVLPSSAAGKLGLVPQRIVRTRFRGRSVARCHSLLHGPYRLADGDRLQFQLDGGPAQTATFRAANFADIAEATPAEVAAVINAVAPGVAQSVCYSPAARVNLVAKTSGTTLTIGGSAAARLNVAAGAVPADAGHHALVVLDGIGVDVRNTELTVQAGAGGVVTVDLDDLERPDRCRPGDLARLLQRKLDADLFGVGLHDLEHVVRVSRGGAGTATAAGTAVAGGAIALTPAPPAATMVTNPAPFSLVNAPPFTFVVGDGANTATVTFNAALNVADRAIVSAHELRRVTAAAIAAVPVATRPDVRVDLDLDVRHAPNWDWSDEGSVSEVAFCVGDPSHVWAGDASGCLYRSTDGGTSWRVIAAPELADRFRPVEAVVIHPTDPGRVLVGLEGTTRNRQDTGFLFRTTNGGESWSHVGGDVTDGEGFVTGVNGLEVDPDEPDVVWAATNVGVFRSDNFGGRWQPYNHGLPNAEVKDVVFEPVTRTLKVGLWGRGVWSRHVGDRPPRDVALLVRASSLDDGSRPVLRGADPVATTPSPAASGSPDIKVTRRMGAALAGGLLDGVEFDERVVHEPPAVGASTVCVQVHNRGAFSSGNVRVTAAWAALSVGRPPRLAAAFFSDRAAGNLAVDSVHGGWQVIGDDTLPDGGGLQHDVVGPDAPRVMRLAYSWPAAAITGSRIAIVAVVSGDGDTSLPGEGDLDELVAAHTKIAFRVTDTLVAADDQVVVLRSTSGQPFQLANPVAPVTPAGGLGLPLGGAAATTAVSASAATFNLSAGAPEGFRIQLQSQHQVSFPASPDIANLAAASRVEVRGVLNRDLLELGIPVEGTSFGGGNVGIRARGAALTRVAGGTAAAILGLTPPGALAATKVGTTFEPFNLSVGAPLDLQVDVQYDHEISFPATSPEIAALGAAAPHQIRAAINRQLRRTGIPVVAEPARVELVVRRSLTELTRHGGVIGGEQFADLVVSSAAVAAADQPRLFDLLTVLRADRMPANTAGHVYVRSANLGNVQAPAVRHRLWSIDPTGAAPFVPQPVGGAINAAVGPGATAIVDFPWNPGAVAAGARLLLLTIADRHPAVPLEPPANFATLVDLHEFCRGNPNAATRLVEIS